MNYYLAMSKESRKLYTSMNKLGFNTKEDLFIICDKNYRRDLIWYLAHKSGKKDIMVLSGKVLDISFEKPEAVSEYSEEHTVSFTPYPNLIRDEGTKGGVFCIVDNTKGMFDMDTVLGIKSKKLVLLDGIQYSESKVESRCYWMLK